jgi:hypothetical protein
MHSQTKHELNTAATQDKDRTLQVDNATWVSGIFALVTGILPKKTLSSRGILDCVAYKTRTSLSRRGILDAAITKTHVSMHACWLCCTKMSLKATHYSMMNDDVLG